MNLEFYFEYIEVLIFSYLGLLPCQNRTVPQRIGTNTFWEFDLGSRSDHVLDLVPLKLRIDLGKEHIERPQSLHQNSELIRRFCVPG